MWVSPLNELLKPWLHKPGVVAFKMLLTSIAMFSIRIFFMDSLYVSAIIVVCISMLCGDGNVTGVAYGHLIYLDFRFGVMPCTLLYGFFMIPYATLVNTGRDIVPIEQFVALLIGQAIVFHMARKRTFGLTPLWSGILLALTLAHDGPYAWIIYATDLPLANMALRYFLEGMLPLTVLMLIKLIFY